MTRDNYYLLLDLPIDPPELDWSKVQAAIQVKRQRWSRDMNIPGKGLKAKANLEQIGEMQRFLEDEARRKEEATAALKVKRQQEKASFAALDRNIKMASLKGYLKEEEVAKLVKKFKSLDEKTIRSRIKVPIKAEEKRKKPKQKPLEGSLAKQIQSNLDSLGKASLYDFLGLGKNASAKALLEETRRMDVENKRVAKKTAAVTAAGTLIGHCLNLFDSEEKRAAYDETLAQAGLSTLTSDLEAAGMDGVIAVVEFDQLMKTAVSLGLSKDDADEFITDYARKKKWMLERPAKLSVDEMIACGQCGLVNSPNSMACGGCGAKLKVACPGCKEQVRNSHRACTHCGFSIGDLPLAERYLREGRKALAANEIQSAKTAFSLALEYWPGQGDATAALAKIAARQKDLDRIVQSLKTAMREKRFYEARAQLDALRGIDKNHSELSAHSQVRQNIDRALSLVEKARQQRDNDKALDFFIDALSVCEDCSEAMAGVAQSPPNPPEGLKAVSKANHISLSWDESPSKREIRYLVLRNRDHQPAAPDDGAVLQETVHRQFDDTHAKPGLHYYYAVFSKRKSVPSKQPAWCGPVMRTGEIENLSVIAGDGRVDFRWTAPHGARAIEVTRREGSPPTRARQGSPVAGAGHQGVSDGGLQNGQMYGYLFVCLFDGPDGQTVASQGVRYSITPVKPPPPINDLRLQKRGSRLDLNWTPPRQGLAQLFSTTTEPESKMGDQLPANNMDRLGSSVQVRVPGEALIDIPHQGQFWVVPVTVIGDLGVVGQPAAFTSIEDVTNLAGSLVGHKICLDWTWPKGAKKALVCYGYRSFPESPESQPSVQQTITEPDYQRRGGFILSNPERKPHFFTVFIAADSATGTIYSGGVNCTVSFGETADVYYEIKIKRSLFGKPKAAALQIYTVSESHHLPEAVLVKKANRLPLNGKDGDIICTIPAGTVIESNPTAFDIPMGTLRKGTYAKLFFRDAATGAFRFMAPSKEKLHLG